MKHAPCRLDLLRKAMCAALLCALPLSLATVAPIATPAAAQSKKAGKADGRQAVIDGIKLYERGRYEQAIAQLTGALQGGGLTSKDLAKALYYRGIAYRKSNQSAKAVTDLTGAVWMEGGLSPSEQQSALAIRSQAYAELGIADPGPPRRGGTPGTSGAPQVAAAPVAGGSSASPAPTSSIGNPLAGVGNFFSNLFSNGSSSSAGQQVATAAPQQSAAAPAPGVNRASPPAPAASGWSSLTAPVPQARQTPTLRPAPSPPTRTAAAAPVTGGYELQVAAVRSRGAAEQLAAQVMTGYSGILGGRSTSIGEKVFGNMGTFYQVSVGPFGSESETRPVCSKLKADGFDCLVVKR